MTFDLERIQSHRDRLNSHPIYQAFRDQKDLQVFMAHHVYSVWDFMSLIKYLQGKLAPVVFPWAPTGHPDVVRFITSILIEEECDQSLPGSNGPDYCSHFELYCRAMDEIGADSALPIRFVREAHRNGIQAAFALNIAPEPSARFTQKTFSFIDTDKPHVVAAAFALGREHIIPEMFRSFLDKIRLTRDQAPAFHYYLERHIHLDEDFHGPLSLQMVDILIEDDPGKAAEAEKAAIEAIEARIDFWDGVAKTLV